MNWYIKVLKKYAVFSGRARRKEYWMFVLFNFIFSLVASLLGLVIFGIVLGGFGPIAVVYSLAVLVPGLAVSVRRLHDIGKSGWYLLIVLIPIAGPIWFLVLTCLDSQAGDNKYGPNPKEALEKIGNQRTAQAKSPNGIKEIKAKTSNIKEIRIGFADPAFGRILGSGSQFDSVAWGAIGSLNPELARTLLAEPRDGPHSGGYRVLVSAFRQDSMDQLMEEVANWSHGMFSNNDIIVQKGSLKMTDQSTGTVQRFDMIIVSVLKSEREKPTVIIGDKLVIIPA